MIIAFALRVEIVHAAVFSSIRATTDQTITEFGTNSFAIRQLKTHKIIVS